MGVALLFFVWAVPEFRHIDSTRKYYDRWQATSRPGDDQQHGETHSWLRELDGWVFSEDSLAQWLMAIFGVAATLVSIVALIWLRATWQEAKRSANIADEQLGAATRRDKLELRAYLAVEPLGINQLIHRMEVMGHVLLRNVGRLPAKDVTLTVRMEISPTQEPDRDDRRRNFAVTQSTNCSTRAVLPGAHMVQGSMERLEISRLAVAHYNVYVFGAVSYDDGYGERKFTNFCHRYSTDSRLKGLERLPPPEESRPVIKADQARYHAYGNEAE